MNVRSPDRGLGWILTIVALSACLSLCTDKMPPQPPQAIWSPADDVSGRTAVRFDDIADPVIYIVIKSFANQRTRDIFDGRDHCGVRTRPV